MKNKNIRNVPKLRFPGFEGEWEQKKLGELCQIEKGKQINKNILLANGKYYVLNGGINPSGYTDKFNTESNTISINEGGSCGFVKLNTERFWSGGHNYTLLKPKCEVKYLYNYLKWREKYINSLAVGTGIPNIQKKVLQGAVSVSYPPIQEQTKIGSFFSTIDALISETEKELEAYREQKRGMLHKMFPKNGADVPEIRFPGFTDAWEQRKVFEIADRFDNLRVPVAANLRIPGNTPYYGANGIQDYVEGYTHDGEYILVAEDGASDLKNYPVNYVNGRIWVNNHAHVLQGKEKIANNKFLSYAMRLADIESVLVGGGRAKLNADIMMNLDIAIPSFNEQEQIGAYFSNLDNLITLHQRELDKLIELKKGFMQKMFC